MPGPRMQLTLLLSCIIINMLYFTYLVLDGLKSDPITCEACKYVMNYLKTLLNENATEVCCSLFFIVTDYILVLTEYDKKYTTS